MFVQTPQGVRNRQRSRAAALPSLVRKSLSTRGGRWRRCSVIKLTAGTLALPKHCYPNCEPSAIINGFSCKRSSEPEQLRVRIHHIRTKTSTHLTNNHRSNLY
ncbi:hypothetical protein JOB18_049108 [Solea senegalensis]|uniref:Uncharacterized protein n=1 Tax=Solea senegalensis TaxID=28829 RepID=A0AAV6PP92_SOLSE|nr:hypothetical protein JOB18_049108 [Solea senegalensis]